MADAIVTYKIMKVFYWVCPSCNYENVQKEIPSKTFLDCKNCNRIIRMKRIEDET